MTNFLFNITVPPKVAEELNSFHCPIDKLWINESQSSDPTYYHGLQWVDHGRSSTLDGQTSQNAPFSQASNGISLPPF